MTPFQLIRFSTDVSHLVRETVGAHVGLVLSHELKFSYVVLFIIPMSYGFGPGVRIVVSASENFKANEGWSLPLSCLRSKHAIPQFESEDVYLKQYRLLLALRLALQEEIRIFRNQKTRVVSTHARLL